MGDKLRFMWRTGTRGNASLAAIALVFLAAKANADSYDEEDLPLPEPDPPAEEQKEQEPEVEDPLTAGGLEAPVALGERTEKPSEVERELAEADAADSGRGLEFAWMTGEIGVTALDTVVFGGEGFLADGETTGGAGVSFGGGLGVRVLYFTLGAHVRAGMPGPLSFLGVSGGASFKLPIGNLEPYAALDLGYLAVSGLARESSGGGLSGVGGFDLRLGIGADYYFSNNFSLGALIGTEMALLERPAYQASDFVGPFDPVYQQPASATAGAFTASLVVGFHL